MRARLIVPAVLLFALGCNRNREAPEVEVGRSSAFLHAGRAVPGQYLIVLKDEAAAAEEVAAEMSKAHGGSVLHTYRHAVKGFAARLSRTAALELSRDPRVRWVEEDGEVEPFAAQNGATWGLDRIDQRTLPLDQLYLYNAVGAAVNVYVIDTGIRGTHAEFGGRVQPGYNLVDDGNGTNDCNGHGTHVSATIGGATYGVAKGVQLYPVRVFGCSGGAAYSTIVAAVDWVTANHGAPAVANMSLGGSVSATLDLAVQNSIASSVTYAIAAGNSAADACGYSPARVPEAITVGATTSADAIASYSNQGACVDLLAPGSSITSAWYTSDTATNTISGTSMATPHVAGVAALYLEKHPAAAPATVAQALVGNSSANAISGLWAGTPNLLVHGAFVSDGPPDPDPPQVALTAPAPGAVLAGTATFSADASDSIGVALVTFLVNGSSVGSATAPPYTASWDTTRGENGSFQVAARAYDLAGNVATTPPVTV
jgi:subtilisin family serine protease